MKYKIILSKSRAEAEEQSERENRRNNVVVYNVPESNRGRDEDRYRDNVAFCMQLFNSLQVGSFK